MARKKTTLIEASRPKEPVLQIETKRTSRDGKRQLAAYFDRDACIQFKALAAMRDRTVQELLGEAVNDLFTKYGKPPIA